MSKRLSLPHSDYLVGLTLQVQRQLQKAVDNPQQRSDLLIQLFTDVALEVDERAQDLLYRSGGNTPIDGNKTKICFYEVIAERYVQVPEDGKAVLPLFVKLWSQSFASQIFALLFYQWLFEGLAEEDVGFIRYSRAYLEGAANVFWIDVQSDARRFFSLYHYTFSEVALKQWRLQKLNVQAQKDLVLLICRFLFLYEPGEKLADLLQYCPAFSTCSMGNPADVFVVELTDQLRKIKVEPVLLHYLRSAKFLKGLELAPTTTARLKSVLYSLTAPGGPMYPTKDVRLCAWDVLDYLFPVGHTLRHLISFVFCIFHPYYWSASFCRFLVTFIIAMLYKVLGMIRGIWEWILTTLKPHYRRQ